MRIYDGAVLLIIGSAIIGPILPRESGTGIPNGADGCMECGSPGEPSCPPLGQYTYPACESRHETTAETCERAMKEAGVENSYAGQKPDGTFHPEGMLWKYPGVGDVLTRQPMTVIKKQGGNGFDNKMFIGHAYCIPAPTGLR